MQVCSGVHVDLQTENEIIFHDIAFFWKVEQNRIID